MSTRFADRRAAGRALAPLLAHYRGDPSAIVLALPRGGVPVAFEVARALGAPLDVFVVRKLGLPGHEEFAMGAIASGGVRVDNPDVAPLALPQAAVDAVVARARAELARREALYRGDRAPLNLSGRTVILVDDGLATGASMRAAVAAVRMHAPARVIVAVPVAASETCAALRREADEVVCALTPAWFTAVGAWYADFTQTSDAEVHQLLSQASQQAPPSPAPR
jgi:predicted phosphoribosyltransferase